MPHGTYYTEDGAMHGPVNGPDGPVPGFQDSVIATAMNFSGGALTVIKEQDTEGAYIGMSFSIPLEDAR